MRALFRLSASIALAAAAALAQAEPEISSVVFVNVDSGRRSTPSGVSADGSSGQTFSASADAARVRDILRTNYGYDPGALGEFSRKTDNNKVFVRGDGTISDRLGTPDVRKEGRDAQRF